MKHRTTFVGRFALTGVALAASCLFASPTWALGLGRITVQSALGETLRAEIDVTSMTPEEASTLLLKVANADVYRAAGIEYNSILPGAKVTLERGGDGRSVLKVTSERAVTEPFLDVILEANWSAGRLVRAYTLLLDPPRSRVAAAPPAATPAVAPAPMPAPAPAPRPAAAAPAPQPMAKVEPKPAPPAGARAENYRVRSGDTLSGIASRNLAAGASLDQMLVALYRANPHAFVGKNMNRLMAGAVLDLSAASAATEVDSGEARQLILAQSADFASYRQRLAAGVGQASTEAPSRQAKGTVQAVVEDRKAGAATPPDKLTLTRPSGKASEAEARASKDAEKKDSTARVAELARNVEELKKLQSNVGAMPASAPAPQPTPAPATQQAAAPTPAATPAAPPAPAPATVVTPAPATPAPVVAKPAPVPPGPVPAEPGLIDSLFDNPLVLPGAVVLVALLVGLGLYRLRGRRKTGGETSFLESRLQPDSFFGASGGQRIDTHESTSSGSSSSMSYSLSQLDAIGDVDPVAEADVYLAYGRDLQAEEILKEAMRATPDRQAIRLKLLEVYAKRRDTKGLELLATQVYSMTKGEGEDWEKAQEFGRSIDPENPLYLPGGQPAAVMMQDGEMVEPLGASTMPASVKPATGMDSEGEPGQKPALDLGLDLDLDLNAPAAPAAARPDVEATQPLNTGARVEDDGLAFELPEMPEMKPAPEAKGSAQLSGFGTLDFDLDDGSASSRDAMSDEPFSGSRLPDFQPSLPPSDAPVSDFGAAQGDPLERKLELAEEFRQIGDTEGARDLLEEVISKADGALKSKAQSMLDSLA